MYRITEDMKEETVTTSFKTTPSMLDRLDDELESRPYDTRQALINDALTEYLESDDPVGYRWVFVIRQIVFNIIQVAAVAVFASIVILPWLFDARIPWVLVGNISIVGAVAGLVFVHLDRVIKRNDIVHPAVARNRRNDRFMKRIEDRLFGPIEWEDDE
jgi:hypothetical protein